MCRCGDQNKKGDVLCNESHHDCKGGLQYERSVGWAGIVLEGEERDAAMFHAMTQHSATTMAGGPCGVEEVSG